MDWLWESLEYMGETLVFFGVVGEVLAERKLILKYDESRRDAVEGVASWVLIVGLAVSLVALVGTNEHFNGTIADLNAHAAQSNRLAAAAQLDAANARKETAQLQKDTQGLKTDADTAKRDMVKAQLELARLTAPIHVIPVIHGVATPDLSAGLTQRVLLTTEVTIAAPRIPKGRDISLSWTLFLTQDSVGGHKFKIAWVPGLNENLVSPGGSQWTFEFVTDSHGHTSQRGIAGYDEHPMIVRK